MYCVPRAQQQSLKAFFSKPIFFQKFSYSLTPTPPFLHKAIFFLLKEKNSYYQVPTTYNLFGAYLAFPLMKFKQYCISSNAPKK